MRDKPVFEKLATAFAAGFFVAAVVSAAAASVMGAGAPNFTRMLTETVNSGLGAVGIRVAGAVGLEMLMALAGGVSAAWLSAKKNLVTS
jgi:hypothetical protein